MRVQVSATLLKLALEWMEAFLTPDRNLDWEWDQSEKRWEWELEDTEEELAARDDQTCALQEARVALDDARQELAAKAETSI